MQISGYTGNGLSPFINRYGAAAHEAKGLWGSSLGAQLRIDSPVDTADISQTFAQDIVSRINTTSTASTQTTSEESLGSTVSQEATTGTSTATQEQAEAKDTSGLQASLARAVDYVRDNFGDAAAQATMGLIYKNVGNQEVSEENLGEGMLDALRFIDKNFGFAAGDKVMAFFNQDVNKAMNDYFDNGLMETFYASSPGGGGTAQGLQLTSAMQEVAKEYGQNAVQSLMDALESALEEGQKPGAALRLAVEQTGEAMAAQYGGDAENHATLISQSLAPLLHGQSQGNSTALGTQLDVTV